MSALLDYMQLCRLCLVKEKVNVPIFGETSDVRQIFLKITACLPVKVSRDDNLPKKICDSCLYKVDLLYQFWNTTVNAEKQLIQWLAEIGVDVNIKNSDPPPLQMLPQSHAHPHSMQPETILLKEERPDTDPQTTAQAYPQTVFSGYDMGFQQQGAATFQQQAAPAEQLQSTQVQKATPLKRARGRPPKAKNTPAPAAKTRTPTKRGRRAARASVSSAESSDDSIDDRLGAADDSDDDSGRIAKEEAESDEDYVDNPESLEPTTFVGVPSTSGCDADQPGPSGLATGKPPNATTVTDPGRAQAQAWAAAGYQIIGFVPVPAEYVLQHACRECPARFATVGEKRRHARTHLQHTVPCPVCGKKFRTNTEMQSHRRCVHSAEPPPHACDQCHRRFHQPSGLRAHMRFHLRDFSHFCDDCGRGFFTQGVLTKHRDVEHRGVRFICFPCNKVFKSEPYLRYHRAEKHDPDTREVACGECGALYRNPFLLKRHEQRHREAREGYRFMCEVCGKKLTSAASLAQHQMLHTGERPHVCPTCGKAFNKRGLLRLHSRVHTGERPHACATCGKRFTQRSSLTIHQRLHSGQRPYACHLCPKRFVSKNLLKVHSKVHGIALADIRTEPSQLDDTFNNTTTQ